jgi:hypothetical protein
VQKLRSAEAAKSREEQKNNRTTEQQNRKTQFNREETVLNIMWKSLQRIVMLSSVMMVSSTALADAWRLNTEVSTVSIASTKNDSITERHQLNFNAGSVEHSGSVRLLIDLLSVETNIPIRNERMRKLLFNQHPIAVIEGQLSKELLDAVLQGQAISQSVEVMLQANDDTQNLEVALRAKLQGSRVKVVGSTELDVAELGYAGGVAQLKQLAGLASISTLVPVTFELAFDL